jgi:uncharacterized membrane protein
VATLETTPSPAPRVGARFSLLGLAWLIEIVALGITGYMTYTKLFGEALPCAANSVFNCAVAENSAWAWIIGIPTSAWGLFAHIIIVALLLLAMRVAFFQRYGVLLVFGVALFGALYHTYLIYIQVAVLRALCSWCLAAATCMYLQLIVTGFRLRNTLKTGA